MSYGTGSVFDPSIKVFSFNLKDKDLPSPLFEIQVKGEDGKYIPGTPPTATRVGGRLTGVRHKEIKILGNKIIKSVTVTLQDGKERYYISIPYTFLGRNILNSIVALTSFDNVEISVYKGKPKNPGQPGFSSSAVRQNGELVYGKYEYKDLPAIPKVEMNGQLFSNATDIDAFFKKLVDEFGPTVTAAGATQGAEAAHEEAPVAAGAETDSMPF